VNPYTGWQADIQNLSTPGGYKFYYLDNAQFESGAAEGVYDIVNLGGAMTLNFPYMDVVGPDGGIYGSIRLQGGGGALRLYYVQWEDRWVFLGGNGRYFFNQGNATGSD
jgi:hypothetical protein